MNTERISQHWLGIGPNKSELVTTFYRRLFERHPRFRVLFPLAIERQMEKMVETLALVAEYSDTPDAIHPRLMRVGEAHRRYDLSENDFDDFVDVLIETIAEFNSEQWCEECGDAWRQALQQVVLPSVREGMH
ncbi:MAG: globin domain-containing protein [Gammaproteobacteria bacterium]